MSNTNEVTDWLLGKRDFPLYPAMELKQPIRTSNKLFTGWNTAQLQKGLTGTPKKIEVKEIVTGEIGFGTGYEIHVDTEADRAWIKNLRVF